MTKFSLWLRIFICCFLVGCATPVNRPGAALGGIRATGISTSIGSAGKDSSQQVLSYRIALKNGEANAVAIHSITFLLANELEKRLVSDRKVAFENTIDPGATIVITGQLTFDATGVSKEQIIGWEPLIKGMFATTDQTVIIETQRKQ